MGNRVSFVQVKSSGRLDVVLTDLLAQSSLEDSHLSRSQVKKKIEGGLVTINGIIATKAGLEVEEGDEIHIEELTPTGSFFEPYELPLSFLFEDEEMLVVDKPAPLTVHPGAGTGKETLLNALIASGKVDPERFTRNHRPGIVHRLDKETSGVILVAKHSRALAALSEQFQQRRVYKEYLALALRKPRGGLPFDHSSEGTITTAIGRHPHESTKMCVRQDGKAAHSSWRIIERTSCAVLLQIVIATGRTHQIRVHLESIGSGVLGDRTYGNFDALPQAALSVVNKLDRQALHAHRIKCLHPKTQRPLEFVSDFPQELSQCFEELQSLEAGTDPYRLSQKK
ncbi:RluA family pseudouridine synthase [bacterium]|nr:RluA family pseudouridine synthase [bacterium]